MKSASHLFRRAGALALSLSLLLPTVASAHALFGDSDPNRPLAEYLWLGFLHMVAGWDHLLFIVGVVLLAGTVGRAAKVVSLFVVGHSITLLTATLTEWQIDATTVDVVIALSLVYVGVQGLRGRPDDLRVFGAVVLAFGLVHGLGLSTRLQDLGLPDSGLVERVLLFNVGVELGQLAALSVIVGLGLLIRLIVTDATEWSRVAYISLAAAGLTAAAVLSFPAEDDEPLAGGCAEEETQVAPLVPGADHPDKSFYGPEEPSPEADLDHVVGDGYLILRYRPDLPRDRIDAIEGLVDRAVVAAPDPDQDKAIRAIQAEQTLACDTVDIETLAEFRDDWFARVQQ